MYQKKANSQKKVNFLTIQDLNNLISSAIPAITILGTIFGASITYKYLDSINQKSIFPDIIGTPSAFLSVSIVFSLMLFCLFLSLSIPYSILFFNEHKKTESKKNNLWNESIIILSRIMLPDFFIFNTCLGRVK